jgi:hypothetical protein
MTLRDWFFAVVEAILWYSFIYYALYSIKNEVDISVSAFFLIIIAYAAALSCPFIRHTATWKSLWK